MAVPGGASDLHHICERNRDHGSNSGGSSLRGRVGDTLLALVVLLLTRRSRREAVGCVRGLLGRSSVVLAM
jgi:hypothetical protein